MNLLCNFCLWVFFEVLVNAWSFRCLWYPLSELTLLLLVSYWLFQTSGETRRWCLMDTWLFFVATNFTPDEWKQNDLFAFVFLFNSSISTFYVSWLFPYFMTTSYKREFENDTLMTHNYFLFSTTFLTSDMTRRTINRKANSSTGNRKTVKQLFLKPKTNTARIRCFSDDGRCFIQMKMANKQCLSSRPDEDSVYMTGVGVSLHE